MNTPDEFIQAQIGALHPRWDILVRLPLEVTAPHYPALRQKWADRNLRSFGDVLRTSGLLAPHGKDAADPLQREQLSGDAHAEVVSWLDHLKDAFITLAAEEIKKRRMTDSDSGR